MPVLGLDTNDPCCYVAFVDTTNRPYFFDVLCEHDPADAPPDGLVGGVLRIRCWVKLVAARSAEEAADKAKWFLTQSRGARNIVVKKWRYSRRPQGLGRETLV